MPKLDETTTTGGFFKIDDLPYQKGDYVFTLDDTAETLEVRPKTTAIANSGNKIINIEPTGFASWTDSGDSPYATYADLKSAVEVVGFLA